MRLRNRFDRPVWWVVLSPEHDHSSYDEPPDPGRDVLFAFAISARAALRMAIRAWRRNWWKGCHGGKTITPLEPFIVEYPDANPMAVLTVNRQALLGDLDRRVRP